MRESTVKAPKILTRRDLTPKMWSVVCHLKNGNKMHRHSAWVWIDCGYEAGVARGTFIGLLRRGLIVPALHHSRYRLSARGKRWSKLEFKP